MTSWMPCGWKDGNIGIKRHHTRSFPSAMEEKDRFSNPDRHSDNNGTTSQLRTGSLTLPPPDSPTGMREDPRDRASISHGPWALEGAPNPCANHNSKRRRSLALSSHRAGILISGRCGRTKRHNGNGEKEPFGFSTPLYAPHLWYIT